MADSSLISLIELGVLAVGAAITVFEIRNIGQTRKTEVALQFFDKLTRPEFWDNWRHVVYDQRFESVKEWNEKYGAVGNPESFNKFLAILNYYTAAGDILQKGLVNLEDIENYASPIQIVALYEKFIPLLEQRAEFHSMTDVPNTFRYLYNEIRKKYPKLVFTSPYKQ
jgi:hypothetical protein